MVTISDPKIGEFLTKDRVCSLTTLLPDGSPHASALHFSHSTDPFVLYFSVEKTCRKCEALLDGKSVKASVVVGFSEVEWLTLQMDGEVRAILDVSELTTAQQVHYAKIKEAEKYKDDPTTIFLVFTPTWLRYTDFKTQPPTIISSN